MGSKMTSPRSFGKSVTELQSVTSGDRAPSLAVWTLSTGEYHLSLPRRALSALSEINGALNQM